MRRFLAFATVIALCLTLFACTADDAPVDGDVSPVVPSVEATVTLPEDTAQPSPSETTDVLSSPIVSEEPGAVNTPTAIPSATPTAVPSAATATPAPETPSPTATETVAAHTVSLYIYCKTLIDNLDKLPEEKRELVPSDGIILALTDVDFDDGDSVFHVLRRETRRLRIPMEFSNTPGFGTSYIEGIANLYQLDAGSLSGWTYSVNGEFPGYGCSSYTVQSGDEIVWYYTLDLGADVGSDYGLQGE